MVLEEWTEELARNFANQHELSLDIRYENHEVVAKGYVFYQNREAGTKIVKGAPLIIKISMGPITSEDTTDSSD